MRLTSNTEWLFFHLWKKNSENNKSCPGVILNIFIKKVFIADSIIYRYFISLQSQKMGEALFLVLYHKRWIDLKKNQRKSICRKF